MRESVKAKKSKGNGCLNSRRHRSQPTVVSLYPREAVGKLEARARSAQNFIQGIPPYSLRDGNRFGGTLCQTAESEPSV